MHILHMEDDGPLCEIFKVAFEAAVPEAKMEQFEDSDSVIKYLNEAGQNVDIFILDIRVPGKFNGLELAQHIRSVGIKAPIVITSAYGRPKSEWLENQNAYWMTKPWHIVDAPRRILPLVDQNKTPSPVTKRDL